MDGYDRGGLHSLLVWSGSEVRKGDVAQWLESRNSNPKTLGLIPCRGRVRGTFNLSFRVNSCADLFCFFVRTARTQIVEHVKDS